MPKKTKSNEVDAQTAAKKKEKGKPSKVSPVAEQKKITTEAEKKRISAKPEAVKLTTGKEPKKLTTEPQPKKISAKPEPKRIPEKKKDGKVTTKEKAAKVEKEKTLDKKEKGKVKKQPVTKKKKISPYVDWSIEECIKEMQTMGVQYVYEDYVRILLDDANRKQVEKNIIEGNNLKEKGHNVELVALTLDKIANTMDVKASDFKDIQKDIGTSLKVTFKQGASEENAAEYLKQFKISEKLLMIGQRKHITVASELSELLGTDVEAYIRHFFAFAYQVLPTWQYDDVKFYEDFAYAILSQYSDLFERYQLKLLIDCADLYIKHGDFQHGDENYGYILRENQIKDYIYYRFASIYEDIDISKAKALAHESLEYVDERYEYYKHIVDIINRPIV